MCDRLHLQRIGHDHSRHMRAEHHRDLAAPLQRGASARASAISRRTSSGLDCQKQRPVMQRARTLRCAGLRALARCTTRSARSTCMKHGTPSQANRGPKNPGRSAGPPPQQAPSKRHWLCPSVKKLFVDRFRVVDLAVRQPCHRRDGGFCEMHVNEGQQV
jgi:hypothetical protein